MDVQSRREEEMHRVYICSAEIFTNPKTLGPEVRINSNIMIVTQGYNFRLWKSGLVFELIPEICVSSAEP